MRIGAVTNMPFQPSNVLTMSSTKSAPLISLSEKSDLANQNPIQQVVNQVNESQLQADKSMEDFSTGNTDSIHRVIVDMEEAVLSMKLATQIRNKALEAYQDIMRMQI